MADEQPTVAPTELAPPASAPEQPNTPIPDRHAGVEDIPSPGEEVTPPAEEAPPAPEGTAEFEVIELDGKQYQVPPELKGAFMKNADYTQKSQANSATAKELAAERERIAEQAKAVEQEAVDRATLSNVNAELKKYEKVDWMAWNQQDPGAVQEHKLYVEQLREQKAAAEGRLTELQTTRSREAQQNYAKRVEDTKAFAESKIQGWSPEVDDKIQKFVASVFQRHGVEAQAFQKFIATNLNPAIYDLAHKAWIGEQTLAKQTAAPKPITVVPLTTVKAGAASGARQELTELAKADNVEAYAAMRQAQRAQKAR